MNTLAISVRVTNRSCNQDGARPVAAELGVGGVRSRLSRWTCDRLVWGGQVCEARSATGNALREALLGRGDGKRRGGEKHLAEQSRGEHHEERVELGCLSGSRAEVEAMATRVFYIPGSDGLDSFPLTVVNALLGRC